MSTLIRVDQIRNQIVDRTGDQLVTGIKKFLSSTAIESGLVVSGTLTGNPPFKFTTLSLNHISLFSGHSTGAVDGRTKWQVPIGNLSTRVVGGDSNSGLLQIAGSGGIIVAPGDIGSYNNTVLITCDLSGTDITFSSAQPSKNPAVSGLWYVWNSGNSGTYYGLNTALRWSDSNQNTFIQTGMGRSIALKRDDLASIDFGLSGTNLLFNKVATLTGTIKLFVDDVIQVTGQSVTNTQWRWLTRTGVRAICSTCDPAEQLVLTIDPTTGIIARRPLIISGAPAGSDWTASGLQLIDVVTQNRYVLYMSGGILKSGVIS